MCPSNKDAGMDEWSRFKRVTRTQWHRPQPIEGSRPPEASLTLLWVKWESGRLLKWGWKLHRNLAWEELHELLDWEKTGVGVGVESSHWGLCFNIPGWMMIVTWARVEAVGWITKMFDNRTSRNCWCGDGEIQKYLHCVFYMTLGSLKTPSSGGGRLLGRGTKGLLYTVAIMNDRQTFQGVC